MPSVNSGRQRPASMSSMRSRKWPPAARAALRANRADQACPRCSRPVGLGAKRVTVMSRCYMLARTEAQSGVPAPMTGSDMLSGPSHHARNGAAKQHVVLLHGLGAAGHDLIAMLTPLAEALPDTAFVAPGAHFPCATAPSGTTRFRSTAH